MSTPVARHHHTFEDYLALDEASNVRLEFCGGDIFAMAGGSPEHAALAVQVASAIDTQLGDRNCRVYSSDLRIRVAATGLATYPDVSVVCGPLERDPASRDTIVNPVVVVEVLSPSTADYDRGEKREHYEKIPSLLEIVLLDHETRRIEIHRRSTRGWQREVVEAGGIVRLESVDCDLDVDQLYARAGA